MTDNFVEGQTAAIDYTLYANGSAINGTGLTIGLQVRDRAQALVNPTGKIAWLVAASGTVRYSPAVDDLKAERSPYRVRFTVTDGSGLVSFYPDAEAIQWDVRK